ncbi:MAG: DEAD/DEAH box helicase [Planctomycetaceae bacterium]
MTPDQSPANLFHPIVREWFHSRYDHPTAPQEAGWPSVVTGKNTLIAAPTGSGKTLTAFLVCIDRLVRRAVAGPLPDEMSVVYVSPLRALSNDMQQNLEQPLTEITKFASERGVDLSSIRVGLRTGDTSSSKRQSLVRKPPHLFVTTPESLYLMLTSVRGREALKTVETIIVDEIHALVRDKRGSHLSITMERLEALCGHKLQRIGLSATQRPIERVARFLVGASEPEPPKAEAPTTLDCNIINIGHSRQLDIAIETPPSELQAVCSHEQWDEAIARILELIGEHESTLIFVNTRRMAERITHMLTESLGEDLIGSHHGSLSSDKRLKTEKALKEGELKAVVATASLELGLDVGYIDLVIQIGTPRAISTFLQRIGRSGHSLGLTPKGRIFALSRDELMECMGLVRAVRSGLLDALRIPEGPLDILAQQIVAEVVGQEWDVDELFNLIRRADPYRDLSRERYEETLNYLADGITNQAGRSRVYLHYDRVGQRLRARKGAQISATSNGGAIPDIASFRVVTEDGTVVGSLDEEFAIESSRGDIFLLGNTSWRLLQLTSTDVIVADAQGMPPTIPFWQGEAPGRTLELSQAVSELREDLDARVKATDSPQPTAVSWLLEETSCDQFAAEQVVNYIAAQKAAVGVVPTQKTILFERFFDETGGMQLVVHAPFGAGICKAWGFSMRKRFCRSFDFELQATADDDGFILSLGPQHSFPIESLFPMLTSTNAYKLLEQAILQVPMFQLRWRWNVTRALLVARRRNGKRVPPNLQRFRADDLLTAVFPKLTGCQEEHTGDHQLPDHPLAEQTMADCMFEALDYEGLIDVLKQVEAGEITFVACDSREPSPFSYELLNSNPYAFLDGGEVQERRARAVATRRSLSVENLGDLARLDPAAIDQVRQEACPQVRSADELHDLLLTRIAVFDDERLLDWEAWFTELADSLRATTLKLGNGEAWVSAEKLPAALAVFAENQPTLTPNLTAPIGVRTEWPIAEARVTMIRGLMETCGPTTTSEVARRLHVTERQAFASLEALEGEGLVLRGRFECETAPDAQDDAATEWCHRRLLARIHRLTIQGLRQQIEPVDVSVFWRFLFEHHEIGDDYSREGPNAVFDAVAKLQGLEIPAAALEPHVLSARVRNYQSGWLDELCLNGEVGWGRLSPYRPKPNSNGTGSVTKVAPISVWLRSDLDWLRKCSDSATTESLSEHSKLVFESIRSAGASFASDLMLQTKLELSDLKNALSELANRGLLTSDGFAGLRSLMKVQATEPEQNKRPSIHRTRSQNSAKGRWSVWREPAEIADPDDADIDQWAWQLLRRWGVVFRDLVIRESNTPRWYRLLQAYRRLEARGEVRGGRFIAGVAGEQFAAADTVRKLRQLRDDSKQTKIVPSQARIDGPHTNESREPSDVVVLSAADPLNLIGIITSAPKVPRKTSNLIAFQNGVPIAAVQAGELVCLRDSAPSVAILNALGATGHPDLASSRSPG